MEGNIFLLGFAVVGIIIIACLWFSIVFDEIKKKLTGLPAENKKEEKKAVTYTFTRVNGVEGILSFDGRKIRTYQTGTLQLDGTIVVDFFDGSGRRVDITDILYKDQSLYSFAPRGPYIEKSAYAVQVVKEFAQQGKITWDLAVDLERLVLEVNALNEYLAEGTIRQIADTGDFVAV